MLYPSLFALSFFLTLWPKAFFSLPSFLFLPSPSIFLFISLSTLLPLSLSLSLSRSLSLSLSLSFDQLLIFRSIIISPHSFNFRLSFTLYLKYSPFLCFIYFPPFFIPPFFLLHVLASTAYQLPYFPLSHSLIVSICLSRLP